MGRYSVLRRWFDVGPISYDVACVISFIWAWHKPIRTLSWTERNILVLSYVRTPSQNDSWSPDKRICIVTFHSVSGISSWIIIFPVGGCQMCFPWTFVMTTSLCLQTMSRKCRMFPQNLSPPPTFLDVLVLRLTGNYISVPGIVTALFDVPLVL